MLRQVLVRLFQVLLFVTPFAFSATTDELFEFNKILLVYGLTLTIAVVWLARMVHERRLIWKTNFLSWFVLLYWIGYALSALFSIHLPTSIFGYYSRFHGGILSISAYMVLFFAAVSNFTKKDLRPLLSTQVLAATLVAAYAVPEHFNWSLSCNIIQQSWDTMSTACWSESNNPFYRIFGTFGQPNWLAAYLVTTLPLTAWLLQSKKHATWIDWWPVISAVSMTMAIIYTKSRSGILALLFAVISLMILTLIPYGALRAFPQKTQKLMVGSWLSSLQLKIGIGFFVGIMGLLLLLGTPFTAGLLPNLYTSLYTSSTISNEETPPPIPAGTALENGGTDSGKIRTIVWKGAFDVWKRYPMFGSGPETFAYSYYQDRPVEHNLVSEWDFLYNKAHNEYINTLATRGLVGFITEVLLIGGFAVLLFWNIAKNKDLNNKILALVLLTSYGALTITNFFGFSTVMTGILFFLIPAFWEVANTQNSQAAQKKSSTKKENADFSEPKPIWIAYAALAAALLYGWVAIYATWYNDVLLAQSKASLSAGDAAGAYQTVQLLTNRAPREALYWENRAITMATLASATAASDATTAATLAEDARISADTALALNPVHLNYWKSKVRVLLALSPFDETALPQAVDTLQQATSLAPTDPKLTYNIAVIQTALGNHEEAEQHFETTLTLKPNYEEARNAYADLLATQGRLQEALDQYQYILENINPQAPTALQQSEILSASISAQQAK